MASLQQAVLDLKNLDLLANGNSPIHRLDARAKVLVSFVFIICVVSCDRYEVAALFPFCVFPVVMISLSDLPPLFIIRKIALICPFVLAVGILNPVFDREILMQLGPLGISGGWMSFASILIRSTLTVGTACILVGVTGFTAVCQALERLGVPQIFAVQLLFLYRYIFVLTEESDRASRSRALRSCGKSGKGIRSFGSLTGHLLLRTWQRAERIHIAMLSRGFRGEFRSPKTSRFGTPDLVFVLGWTVYFAIIRSFDIPRSIGALLTGGGL